MSSFVRDAGVYVPVRSYTMKKQTINGIFSYTYKYYKENKME